MTGRRTRRSSSKTSTVPAPPSSPIVVAASLSVASPVPGMDRPPRHLVVAETSGVGLLFHGRASGKGIRVRVPK